MEKPIYKVGDELRLEELSPEQLAYLQQSQMAGISTDPRYKDAELAALTALEERSTKGMTAQDEADMYKLQRNVSTQNRGRMGAIQNNMAVRGMSGSGMDALMQLQSSQDAADREALSAMEKAGQIQQNKMQASERLGQMGSQMRGQDFQEQAAKARAADEIARFNASTRNQAMGSNVNTRNQATGQNWNRRNQVGDQNTTMSYNYDAEQANRQLLKDQEEDRKRKARAGVVPGLIGAGIGSVGGPMGAGIGYQVGSTIGGYAYGGDVRPDEDDPSLDVVPALLSPGEHVLPRSVMSSKDAFEDYTNRLKEAVKERQKAVDSAESNAKMGQYGSVFANALNDYSKANRSDVVLHNNIQNMGRAPTVSQGEYSQIKDTWSDPLNKELARADKNLVQGRDEFQDSEQMKNFYDQKKQKDAASAAMKDPNSQESIAAREAIAEVAPEFASRPAFKTMSAALLEQAYPKLRDAREFNMKDNIAREGRLARQASDSLRTQEFGVRMAELKDTKDTRAEEKRSALVTPYGLANTPDDAKKLKEAYESKQSFDAKIQEMIDLRKEFGGETFNREAVARGKQLSKDLLLEYKNMAKLGVLSKSDEDIINAIIPKDPLEFQFSSMVGQDPIMNNLQKFKADSDRDFQTRVKTRTKAGQANPQGNDLINSLQLPSSDPMKPSRPTDWMRSN